MKKFRNYLLIVILCVVSFIAGVSINSVNAKSPEQTSVQSINNIQGVAYDYVYVNGTRYIVFMSSTGDIEVVR